ncbi:membrane or secreted protein [Marinilongibacter aquaticus]|uniref:membrane or secreted protein n=1 Tax=Marinilongibacter aquaticus TaxID=2975157 RepID=UPI0021BD941D|nr:membrane or secreted protein [Marinilongibacter aquaticus]UBM58292.1 membrane or secreted protein [Marinilongibacter aquaticus]
MKKYIVILLCSLPLLCRAQDSIEGAWLSREGTIETVLQVLPAYITVTHFDEENKSFSWTWGGSYVLSKRGKMEVDIHFDSRDSAAVGQLKTCDFALLSGTKMNFIGSGFERIDAAKETPLAGVWRISSRGNGEGEMREMPLRARRTLKVLTGTRFQWIAMNIETGQFFGTGGGTYTLENGQYTEHIRFFSRDGSRVGAELSFDAKVGEEEWLHSGKSSKGSPIKEVWSKID